ncbi:MAG TPA: phage holin family protein [Polyangiaceae bacterium]|jgi:hypothetical protein
MSAQAFETGKQEHGRQLEADAASTAALLKEGIEEARELVRLEVELAKHEALQELKDFRAGAYLVGAAALALLLAFAAVVSAFVVATGAVSGIVFAGVLVVVGAVLGYAARARLSAAPMKHTRRRLEAEARDLAARVT